MKEQEKYPEKNPKETEISEFLIKNSKKWS